VTLTAEEDLIAMAITRAIGRKPIILCGSRAIDDAAEKSDYDVFVVFPALEIPIVLTRLESVSQRLEEQLGAPVTINPLPRFRLHHPGPNLLMWKIRREGKVLKAPAGFELEVPEQPSLSVEATSSYAVSGIRFLIGNLDPPELSSDPLSKQLQRDLPKAILHLAQLRLLRRGTYASRFDEALALLTPSLGDEQLLQLAESRDQADAWFGVRDLLFGEIRNAEPSRARALLSNAQYVALSALRGSGLHVGAIRQREAIRTNLEQAAILLADSVQPAGLLDQEKVSVASRLIPRWMRPNVESSWIELRDAIEAHWAHANPLLGL
jgi:predicted nucleotidyltransferase